jgi:hypothetical protein
MKMMLCSRSRTRSFTIALELRLVAWSERDDDEMMSDKEQRESEQGTGRA